MTAFFLRHMTEAWAIGKGNGGDISSAAINFGVNSGLGENASKQGSEVNAMRHTTWQAMISASFGTKIAKEAGDAHEENPYADLTKRVFSGTNVIEQDAIEQADQSADLLNNMIGRKIGSDNSDASPKDLAIKVLTEFHENGLYMVIGNKKGVITIGKRKLTDKEFQNALKLINRLNDAGQTPEQQKKNKNK